MFRRLLLSVTVVAATALAGISTAEAGGCPGRSGFYGGGFYGGGYRPPVYRSVRYYGGPGYYYGPPAYRRSYYGGYPGYYGGYRSGVTFSFGF